MHSQEAVFSKAQQSPHLLASAIVLVFQVLQEQTEVGTLVSVIAKWMFIGTKYQGGQYY